LVIVDYLELACLPAGREFGACLPAGRQEIYLFFRTIFSKKIISSFFTQ
jgi:hypothetical protein